ncbi:transmembrane protein, putative (macronuclear) [Tetrahymena thermophila SB210]|uniref:Transmembrane protein, putative n=1 Tax=Tetrahymena thermophila (strain SB210) TaxID=312017 RepID=I7MHE3_TETTS|nr:transmembrane protein, putative [Tetrahymena thermophila SB210]EAR87451.2 transmembrane protein, putative [Tetrahymena thermophila SB210]|eukprot:XP_001007696.2 transmembrane protein, putative [Tetrahymena thermophila SB210]
MKDCLLLKTNLIQILGNNFVDLNQLYQTSSQLIKQKNLLQTQLIQLHAQNEYSQELLNICSIFEKTLQFSEKLNIFKKKTNKFNVINKLPLKSSDSCVIFVSLINNYGSIIRVSKNFQEVITSYTNQEVINSSLNIIIPNQIYEAHQQQLKHYLQNVESTNQIKNFPLQIGNSKDGWAIPLNIKIQYHQIGEQEIGVSAWIRKQERNSNQYLSLLLDEHEKKCSPVVMSQAFFESIFKEVYTQKQIHTINMNLIAPALYAIIDKCDNQEEKETYIIKPISKAQLTNNQLDYNKNQSYFNDIFQYNEIFCVQFKIYRSQSKFINLAQLELFQVTKVEQQQLKYESLKLLNIQLTKFCNYNLPNQYETIQFNFKQSLYFTNKSIEDIQSRDESTFSQPTPEMINQSSNQKQNKQDNSLLKYKDNMISFENNHYLYEEVQLQNEKEEISLDQNNITSRNLLNQTLTLNELDHLQMIQGMSSTQIEFQKGKGSLQYNSQTQSNSIFKSKNNDQNIEQLINNYQFTKQISTELLDPLTKQTKNLKFKELTNKVITLPENVPNYHKKPFLTKINQQEQSISSMKTTNSKTKKEIINSIKSSKRMLGLIILNYIDLQNFLLTQKISFDYLDWNSDLRIALSSILTNLYMNSLVNLQLLVPKDPTKTTQYVQLFLNQMQEQRIYYSNLTSEYSKGDKDKIQQFKLIMEKKFMYIHTIEGLNYTTNFNLGYTLAMQKSYLDSFRLIPQSYDINSIVTIFYNLQLFDDTLKEIQDNSFNDYSDKMNQILLQQQYNLVSISLITLTCAISILPIYQFIQKKREQILKLMTNISPEKLKQMLGTTSNYLFQIDQELTQQEKQKNSKKKVVGFLKQSENLSQQKSQEYFSNISIQKKKNISQTSNFAKINFKYLLGSLAFFILMQIYSFSIYVIINMYQDNSINNRLFMDQLAEARHFLQIYVGTVYIGFVGKFAPQTLPTSQEYLFNKIKQLQQSSSSYLNNIYSYQNNFYGHSRYKQEDYNQYIIKVLEKNSCDVIKNNPKLLSKNIDFDYNQCKQTGDQLLDQGLVQSLKSVFEFNGQISDLYDIDDSNQFYIALKNLDSAKSLIENPLVIQQISIVIQQLNYFLKIMTNELFDFWIIANLALLISQLTATIIVLVFGWYRFYERIEKSLHDTKQLLEVIDIDVLLDNSYVVSYFKANR